VAGYGYFRDELYYLACADHLDWGYVDQPPLSIGVLSIWRAIFGDSLVALRTPPVLAGIATLWLTILMTRRLGGRGWSQLLAGLSIATAPIYLALCGFYSMNAFDVLLWTAAQYVLLRILELPLDDDARRWWLLLGLVLGLGLLNKLSVLWLGTGIAMGLLLTSQRRRLLGPWPYASAAIALLLFAPHLWWQWRNGFPTLEFIHNASSHKYAAQPPLSFLAQQLSLLNLATAPLWIAGLAWTFRSGDGARFRTIGIAYVVVLAILLLNGTSNPIYLAPAYPFLLAAGAVVAERFVERRALRVAYAVLIVALGVVALPMVVPVLPPEKFVAYSRTIGFTPKSAERKELGALPQYYADRFGWPELAAEVARVYRTLPESERAHVLIVAGNYGEAGAIDFFGRGQGLPPARSQHNSYYLWGPGDWDGSVAIILTRNVDALREEFASVEQAGEFSAPYVMPYEDHLPILVCRGFKGDLRQAWARGKKFT